MADANTKRFLLGIGLAWVPWIPTIIGLAYVFRGMSNTTATGIGVVAGGLGEGFVLWGVISIVIAQVAAIVYLARTFANGSWLRNLVSVISIVLSGLMLVLVCVFLSFLWVQHH